MSLDGDKVYSANEEDGWGDFCSAIDQSEVGDTIYEGTAHTPDVSRLVDADDIIDMLRDRAYDNYGEWAEDFADIHKDSAEYKELNLMLQEWSTRCCPVSFYTVGNITSRTLTQEDFE